jgi:hypothetical protein
MSGTESKTPDVSSRNEKNLEKIIEETRKSIKCYKHINIVIIVAGLLLILGSAVYFVCITKGVIDEKTTKIGYGIFVFGGFGLAGIIVSLITNPAASIVKTARQLIQIQISYFSYLKQVEIIENINEKENTSIKSERLEAVTISLQETLCKYFDSLPPNAKE